eukprot:2607706-Rhodomonas_salina.1
MHLCARYSRAGTDGAYGGTSSRGGARRAQGPLRWRYRLRFGPTHLLRCVRYGPMHLLCNVRPYHARLLSAYAFAPYHQAVSCSRLRAYACWRVSWRGWSTSWARWLERGEPVGRRRSTSRWTATSAPASSRSACLLIRSPGIRRDDAEDDEEDDDARQGCGTRMWKEEEGPEKRRRRRRGRMGGAACVSELCCGCWCGCATACMLLLLLRMWMRMRMRMRNEDDADTAADTAATECADANCENASAHTSTDVDAAGAICLTCGDASGCCGAQAIKWVEMRQPAQPGQNTSATLEVRSIKMLLNSSFPALSP